MIIIFYLALFLYGSVSHLKITPEVLHQVQAIGEKPVITLHLYGDTFALQRFQFDDI
jgi:hypothetical protein